MYKLINTAELIVFVQTCWLFPTSDTTVPVIALRGGGSTFAAHTFIAWMASYRSSRYNFADINMSYSALGSGWGVNAITYKLPGVEYAMSDSVLSNSSYQQFPDLQLFPCIAGLVCIHVLSSANIESSLVWDTSCLDVKCLNFL